MKKITKHMAIIEILEKNKEHIEELAEAIAEAGLHCIGCQLSSVETLEQGFQTHGYSEKDLEKLINKLNKIIEK